VGNVRDLWTPPSRNLPARTRAAARGPGPVHRQHRAHPVGRLVVATYKYALLVALVELYWRQAAPYEADGGSGGSDSAAPEHG